MAVSLTDLAGEVDHRVNRLHWQAILAAFERYAASLGYRFVAVAAPEGTASCAPLPEHRPELEAALLLGRYGDLWPWLDAELLAKRVGAFLEEGEGHAYLDYVCEVLGSLGVAMAREPDGAHD